MESKKLSFGEDDISLSNADTEMGSLASSDKPQVFGSISTSVSGSVPPILLPMDNPDWASLKRSFNSFLHLDRSKVNLRESLSLEPFCSDVLVNSCDFIDMETYAFIVRMALEIDEGSWALNTIHPPSKDNPVILSQRQAVVILACAFLDLFPVPKQEFDCQRLSFAGWHNEIEKLRCLVNYFNVIRMRIEQDPKWQGSLIGYYRSQLDSDIYPEISDWENCKIPLSKFNIVDGENESIEFAKKQLQADFANEYIGGGVLSSGCVQEEIRFTISPECICSLLMCSCMKSTEAILIRGTELFSSYKGYAWDFKFDSTYFDDTKLDNEGFIDNWLVALDAIPFGGRTSYLQYKNHNVLRDLRKCLVAVQEWPGERCQKRKDGIEGCLEPLKEFATGNWGCGAFGGDPELKCIQQWLSASVAGRNVSYFTRKSSWLELLSIVESIETYNRTIVSASASAKICSRSQLINVGELSKIIFQFWSVKLADKSASLFEYLRTNIEGKKAPRLLSLTI